MRGETRALMLSPLFLVVGTSAAPVIRAARLAVDPSRYGVSISACNWPSTPLRLETRSADQLPRPGNCLLLLQPSRHRITRGTDPQSRLTVGIVLYCDCKPRYHFFKVMKKEICMRGPPRVAFIRCPWVQTHGRAKRSIAASARPARLHPATESPRLRQFEFCTSARSIKPAAASRSRTTYPNAHAPAASTTASSLPQLNRPPGEPRHLGDLIFHVCARNPAIGLGIGVATRGPAIGGRGLRHTSSSRC